MFDQRQKDAYRSISAPPSLRAKVLYSARTEVKKNVFTSMTCIRKYAAIAACLIAVIVLGVYASIPGAPSVSVDGVQIGAEYLAISNIDNEVSPVTYRSDEPFDLELGVELKRNAEIEVSDGCFDIVNKENGESVTEMAKGKYIIRWSINSIDTEKTYLLTVYEGKAEHVYELSFEYSANTWQIRRV
ncbi:MAG: hypothetical protein E7623_05130 [Ruminococcaceae bacterium]|nr:hypothetical protein [Oscillospiraceae bacterium]